MRLEKQKSIKVKRGCETNNPTSHCKNCSYKELTPILSHVGVQ